MKQKETRKPNKQKPAGSKKTVVTSKYAFGNTWMWYALAAIILATLAIYFKAIRFDTLCTWDDNLYVRENPDIRNLNWETLKLFFTGFYVGNYQPVTMLFYAAEFKLSAGNAALFHFDNIALHLANTFLVFVLIRKISPSNPVAALITAAFFAVHPMHVESVAWVSERKDVLYSFFFLLSLIQYITYSTSRKIKHLLFSAVFFILSCLSKSAAVILPLIFLLVDYYTGRKTSRKMVLEKLPFFFISLVFGLVAIYSQGKAVQMMTPKMTVVEHGTMVCLSGIIYLFKVIVPVHLSAIYPYPVELGNSALPFWYYFSIPAVILVFIGVAYSRKWGKDVVFGFSFFIIAIVLELQIVNIGRAPVADRYSYIPYIGIFFIIGKSFEFISESTKPFLIRLQRPFTQLLLLGFIDFTVVANLRIKTWENDEVLFNDVLKKYPYEITSSLNTGFYYMDYCSVNKAHDASEKEMYLRKALACFNTVLHYDSAIYTSYYHYKKTLCDTWYNIGIAKAGLDDHIGAIQGYTNAIGLNPEFSNAFNNRGSEKQQIGDNQGAIADFDKAIILSPGTYYIWYNMARSKVKINDLPGALVDYNSTIRLNPAFASAFSGRAYVNYLLRNYERAVTDYSEAISLNPKDEESVRNRDIIRSMLENNK